MTYLDTLEYHVRWGGGGQAREGFTELKDKRKSLPGYEVRDVHSRQEKQVQRPRGGAGLADLKYKKMLV